MAHASFPRWIPLLFAVTGVALAEPALHFDADSGTVRLGPLLEKPPKGTESDVLAVRVLLDDDPTAVPPVAGAYSFDADTLVFRPRFGFDPGVNYEAVAFGESTTLAFALPIPEKTPTTTVATVYPDATELPENHLRFYLHFSAPMSRGFAAKHVRILDAKGKPLEIPFLDLAEELWDREGTRLTLLLDPGRVKSGLVPHEEEGPVLVRGHSYTLEISTGFEDAFGKPLRVPFRRAFSVGEPDIRQPSLEDWKITSPEVGTLTPVVVTFGQLLDHALLLRMIEVVEGGGKRVGGVLAATNGDTACAFTPDAPWKAGPYRLRVNRLLEDPSGNSIARPFELKDETFAPSSLRTHAELDFKVDATGTR